MNGRRVVFWVHAIQRMFERAISEKDVRRILDAGEIIETYPDDPSYTGYLVSGWRGTRPLHVVAADNQKDDEIIVITVYEPDPEQWEGDFRSRKK